jgi:hypothetical protein
MDKELTFNWSTHQPLIMAAMELYTPKFVLELGIGEFSTPLFKQRAPELLSVENNQEWIAHMKTRYPELHIIHHDLKGKIHIGTPLTELTKADRLQLFEFYLRLPIPPGRKLLFCDQYTATRTISIIALKDRFDLIIYHDSEEAPLYDYDLINTFGFNSYILKSPVSWTTMMVRKTIDKGPELLRINLKDRILEYLALNPECKFMELTA